MLAKKTIVDQIEIRRDGSTGIRLGLLVTDGEIEVSCKWHRTVIAGDFSARLQMDEVNRHLEQMGECLVNDSDIQRIEQYHLPSAIDTEQA